MMNREKLDNLERKLDELRRLQKSATTIATVDQKKCPYCSATFSDWLDFAKHLASCGSFKKTVKLIPADGLSVAPPKPESIGGLNVAVTSAERGPGPGRFTRF
jgi:hypothetical protein